MGGKEEARVKRRKHRDDIGMRERRKRDHVLDQDSMCLGTVEADDAQDPDLESAIEEVDRTIIRRMDIPMMV